MWLMFPSIDRTAMTEEFLSHGVIIFHVFHEGDRLVRAVQIEKMRGNAHDEQIRPYRISAKGMTVYSSESPLTIPKEAAAALI